MQSEKTFTFYIKIKSNFEICKHVKDGLIGTHLKMEGIIKRSLTDEELYRNFD